MINANKGCVAEKKYAGGREDLHKERFAEGREGGWGDGLDGRGIKHGEESWDVPLAPYNATTTHATSIMGSDNTPSYFVLFKCRNGQEDRELFDTSCVVCA